MKFSIAISACAFTLALAGPHSVQARQCAITPEVCRLNAATTPAQPFSGLFPTANLLGTVVGPILKAAIGDSTLEQIDALGDALCVNSEEEPANNQGICQELLDQINTLVVSLVLEKQATSYRCILNIRDTVLQMVSPPKERARRSYAVPIASPIASSRLNTWSASRASE